jgi:hypothetical protein
MGIRHHRRRLLARSGGFDQGGNAMNNLYLDAGPMIRALREDPSDFERRHNCVRHRPSRHWLAFDTDGNARIFARCSCTELPINREQSVELRAAVAKWEETHWRPLRAREAAARRVAEINREFARHFGPKSWWRRAIEAVLIRFSTDATEPRFHIDPSLPEDRELSAAAPDRAPVNRDPDSSAPTEKTNA